MGAALWLTAGLLAWVIARFIPLRRNRRWIVELIASLLVAFALGLLATALDFGGWRELDLRPALFCFFGSGAILGIIRVTTHTPSEAPR